LKNLPCGLRDSGAGKVIGEFAFGASARLFPYLMFIVISYSVTVILPLSPGSIYFTYKFYIYLVVSYGDESKKTFPAPLSPRPLCQFSHDGLNLPHFCWSSPDRAGGRAGKKFPELSAGADQRKIS
jgi:hypothetical protein